MKDARRTINSCYALCKVKISLFAVLSAAAGYCVAASKLGMEMAFSVTGVFLLACGSSALNQVQERETDAQMERTSRRPLPSGTIGIDRALLFAAALIVSGLILLALTGPPTAALLGLFAVLWYNGAYTYLKRKTAFAVIPGALVGAIPPAIGWVMAGGALRDPRLSALCFFFFIWQVPHFWVFLLHHGKEYEAAGLPSLSGIFSPLQLMRVTAHWMFATVVSCLFLFLFGLVHKPAMAVLLFLSAWFLMQTMRMLKRNGMDERQGRTIFAKINYYMVAVVILVSLDRLAGLAGYRMS